jgi:hypothetical protein
VNWSAADVVEVPPTVVTVTCTVPVPAGEGTTICVALFEVKLELGTEVPPKLTEVALPRLEPEIVTDVPPAAGPEVGEIDVTAGMAT